MPAKLEDVAQRAGVSIATVSRVLSNKPHVSQEVRKRVLEAAAELKYRPSRVARSLQAQRSRVIGLIIPDIQNPFFTSIVRAVEDIAYLHRYSFLLCNADEDPEKETVYTDLMLAEHVAGVIILPTKETRQSLQRLADAGIPAVAIGKRVAGAAVDTVLVDNATATYDLVTRLVNEGHSRIAAVFGSPSDESHSGRKSGYLRALADCGLCASGELIWTGVATKLAALETTRIMLAMPESPTAICVANNLLTAGVLSVLWEQNLRVPQDVTVVAFDDMDCLFALQPALTVAVQPTYEVGRAAANLLLDRLEDPAAEPQEVMLHPDVHIQRTQPGISSSGFVGML